MSLHVSVWYVWQESSVTWICLHCPTALSLSLLTYSLPYVISVKLQESKQQRDRQKIYKKTAMKEAEEVRPPEVISQINMKNYENKWQFVQWMTCVHGMHTLEKSLVHRLLGLILLRVGKFFYRRKFYLLQLKSDKKCCKNLTWIELVYSFTDVFPKTWKKLNLSYECISHQWVILSYETK